MDEISGNRLSQRFSYRQGYYDGIEREFRGFGLLLQTDNEAHPDDADSPSFTAPCLKKLVSYRTVGGHGPNRLSRR